MDSGKKPYIDDNNIRIFSGISDDFVWHRDEEDRYITPLNETDWKFQFDNGLPICLKKDETIFVEKMIYHRLIIGDDKELVMRVLKVHELFKSHDISLGEST
jgi:hypothetical protein